MWATVSTYDNLRCGLGDCSFNTTFLVVPNVCLGNHPRTFALSAAAEFGGCVSLSIPHVLLIVSPPTDIGNLLWICEGNRSFVPHKVKRPPDLRLRVPVMPHPKISIHQVEGSCRNQTDFLCGLSPRPYQWTTDPVTPRFEHR